MTSRKTFEGPYFKALDDDLGTFEAVVSVFGNVDYQGDRVMPGAFEDHLKSLRAKGAKLPVVWSHDWGNPFAHIGYVDPADALEITTEQAKSKGFGEILGGLYVKGHLDIDKEFARQVYDLLKDGRVREWSFAYDVIDEERAKDHANNLNKLNVWEVGPTLKGANNMTDTIAVKSIKQQLEVAHEIDMGATLLKEAYEFAPEVGLKFLVDFTAKQRERLDAENEETPADSDETTREIADTFKAADPTVIDEAAGTNGTDTGLIPSPTGAALREHLDQDHNVDTGEGDTEVDMEAKHRRAHQTMRGIEMHIHEDMAKALYMGDEKAGFKPWHIAERDGKYCVIKDSDGTTEKCHETRDAAVAHMRALYANEPKSQSLTQTINTSSTSTTVPISNVPQDDKAGRRISKDSEQAIRDAIANLQSLLESPPDEDEPKNTEPESQKDEGADERAHYKALLDSLRMDETN